MKQRLVECKEKLSIDKEALKPKIRSFRSILSINILISICSAVLIIAMLPIILQWMFENIFPYTYTNIDQSLVLWNETGEYKGSDPMVKFAWDLWSSIMSPDKNPDAMPIIRYSFIVILRLIRFLYIVILTLVMLYLILYSILSIIMRYELRMKAIVISCLISSMISLTIAFFLIPNESVVFELFIDSVQKMLIAAIQGKTWDTPAILLNVIIAFYWGFFVTFMMHTITTSILQYIMREW